MQFRFSFVGRTSSSGREYTDRKRENAVKKTYSLKKNKEFQRVYRVGKSCGSRTMVLIYCRARHGSIKVVFSVSKKVGNAVTRNLVKRRMREALRLMLPEIKRNYNIIFVAREAAARESYRNLQKTIQYLLRKTDLLQIPTERP